MRTGQRSVLIALTRLSHSIPILAYHALIANQQGVLPEGWSARHAVHLQAFRDQISFLQAEGWTAILPEDLSGGLDAAHRYVVFTFDDGHDSDMLGAAILREHGYRGIVY